MRRVWIIAVVIGGCGAPAPAPSRTFAAPPPALLEAVWDALRDYADRRVEEDRVETSWGPEREDAREQGLLIGNAYKIRVRYSVRIDASSVVRVRATVERRAPGGPRSLRWERVESDGRAEQELLDAIARRVQPERHP